MSVDDRRPSVHDAGDRVVQGCGSGGTVELAVADALGDLRQTARGEVGEPFEVLNLDHYVVHRHAGFVASIVAAVRAVPIT